MVGQLLTLHGEIMTTLTSTSGIFLIRTVWNRQVQLEEYICRSPTIFPFLNFTSARLQLRISPLFI